MLDHLDDPQPFVPDEHFHVRVARRGARLRWRHRLARGSAGALAAVVLVGSGFLYVERRDDAIDRVEIATQPSADGAVNLLLVGVDQPNGRADTIILVRFADDGPRLLSIPRDLWDDVAGTRINMSSLEGGPQGVVDAVVRITGIPIDHVIQLDLDGFRELVDAIGGVEVAVDAAIRDDATGLNLPPSTCTTLNGDETLALVRARRLEVQDPSGAWVPDPTGDLGRVERGRAIASAAVASLAGMGTDPVDLDRYSRLLADHALLDSELSLGRLVDLGRRFVGAGPQGMRSDVVPVEGTNRNGAAVLQLATAAADVFEQFGAPRADAGAAAPAGTAEPAAAGTLIRPC